MYCRGGVGGGEVGGILGGVGGWGSWGNFGWGVGGGESLTECKGGLKRIYCQEGSLEYYGALGWNQVTFFMTQPKLLLEIVKFNSIYV